MDAYLEDEFIDKCLCAAMYNTEKLLERISPQEIMKIDFNIAWTKGRTILADERIMKKERLKLSMSVAKGAMIIRDQKLKLMHKRLKTFVKSMEHIDVQARIDSEDPQVARTVSKLVKDLDTLEVPDIDLQFSEYPPDRHLLPDLEEETVLYQINKDSESSNYETLSHNMRSFEKYCNQLRGLNQVPEGEEFRGEQYVPEGEQEREQQVPRGEEQVPGGKQQVPEEDQQVRKRKQEVPREEHQVPEIGPEVDANMEVDENVSPDEIPGTPSKRPGSLIRGDDTPSKRGRFSSLIPAAGKDPEIEESIPQIISGIQPLDGPDRAVSLQPEVLQEQQLPEVRLEEEPEARQAEEPEVKEPIEVPPRRPRPRSGRRRGWRDERITLTDKWYKEFPNRTDWYTKPPAFDALKAEGSTKPLAPKVLLKMPGFTIRNENLRELFEQNFTGDILHTVEPPVEGDYILSPEGSLPRPEVEELRNIEDAEQEQPRHEPEISNLMESLAEGENIANVDRTVESRASMGRVSMHHPAVIAPVDETLTIPLEPPRLSVEFSAALGVDETFADNLLGDQFQQDVAQREAGLQIENDQDQILDTAAQRSRTRASESVAPETGPLGIMEDTILAKILDCLTLGDRESIALEEIIPPESENTETAAWSFSCVLVLKRKKKIVLSQNGSKEPIYIRRYSENE